MYTTVPNLITILRFILIPFFLNAFLSGSPVMRMLALLIFGMAAISDFLDGYLARRLDEESEFGRLTDPLADKFLNISVLFAFLNRGEFGDWHTTTTQLIWVILIIEMLIAIYGIRAFYYKSPLKTTLTGKWKTMIQFLFVALTLLLIEAPDMVALWGDAFNCLASDSMKLIVNIFAWLTAIITVASGVVNLQTNLLLPLRHRNSRADSACDSDEE